MYTQTHTHSSRTDIIFTLLSIWHVAVQLPSHVQLFANPWIWLGVQHHTSLSLTISWSLPEFISIASVMPSSHLIIWCPLLLLPSIFPSIRDFSNKSASHVRWPKYWSFIFSTNSSNEYGYSGLIQGWFPLRLTGLISSLSMEDRIGKQKAECRFWCPKLPSPGSQIGATILRMMCSTGWWVHRLMSLK